MSKLRLEVQFRLPPYAFPRNEWRKAIYLGAAAAFRKRGIQYSDSDKLEVEICLYLEAHNLRKHDLDNRAKDVLDSLQARFGGPKRLRSEVPLIPNDSQVFRLIISKTLPPNQSLGLGHVMIRRFRP